MKLLKMIFLSFLLLLTSSAMADEEQETRRTSQALHRLKDESALRSAQIFEITEASCKGMSTRIFFEGPSGERLIAEHVFHPGSGITRRRLTHDNSGWWVEASSGWERGFPVSHLEELFDFTLWQRFLDSEDFKIEYKIRMNGGKSIIISTTRDATRQELVEQELLTSLKRSLRDEDWLKSIPTELIRGLDLFVAISSMRSSTSPEDQTVPLSESIEFLQKIASAIVEGFSERSGFDEGTRVSWIREHYDWDRNQEVRKREYVALLEKFKSIPDPTDPLKDLHAPPDGGCRSPSGNELHPDSSDDPEDPEEDV